ncbi:DUF5916 domain-containing protein [Chitinimonas viridis]|uniref:DUF5916 domain-containing protein n=1 Tax=Chitinimonas viridis TaxID=664880 RepID=A0ABT8B2V4_9NEIS|nr:DUF5916 domain-containing protein [Chitinimonas viridis]MDN3576020.1 DUF5916 domain-containing protein [Chitinimonas viridis]
MHKLAYALALAFALPGQAAINALQLGAQQGIKLDGKLDDAAWQTSQRYDTFYEHTPRDKRPAEQPTAMRIAYDKQYLYVALEAIDPNPQEVREPFSRRDKVLGDQDFFVFYLDPAGDGKAAQFFRVNPRGAVGDGMFTDTGGEDFSPDYDFEAAASRTDTGWTAELRIPFSALAYNGGSKDWKVMLLRSLTRGDRYRLTSGEAPGDTNCFLCYSMPLTGMTPPQQAMNWSITPQILASRAEKTHANGSKTHKNEVDLAVDIKLRPRPDWVLDMTLNPDFSQVELDAPVLAGNSRFAVFLPEKRPFFLEGADLLQGPTRAIHSRAITDPAWGGRATWRGESADATVLTTRDDGGGLVVVPGAYGNGYAQQSFKSQATIARGSLRLGSTQLGGLFTDRSLEQGRGYNRVAGGDVAWQVDDTTRVRTQLLASQTTALYDQAADALMRGEKRDGHSFYADFSKRTAVWDIYAQVRDIGRDFRADNGFITQTGVRSFYSEMNLMFEHAGAWRETNPYLNTEYVEDREGQKVFSTLRPGLFLAGPYDSFYNLEWRPNQQTRLEAGGPLLKRDYVHLFADGAPSKLLNRLTATVQLGDQIDYENSRVGKGGYVSLFARMRLHERLEVEQTLDKVWVDGGPVTKERAYSELAYQWNSIWHFTARDTARFIWQHAKVERNPIAYMGAVNRDDTRNTWSLVYTHQQGLGKAVYLGATLADTRDDGGKRKQNELFVKGSWTL